MVTCSETADKWTQSSPFLPLVGITPPETRVTSRRSWSRILRTNVAGKVKAQSFSSMPQPKQDLKNWSLLQRPKERNRDPYWCFALVLATSEHHLLPLSVISWGLTLTSTAKYRSALTTSLRFHAWQVPLSNSAPTRLILYKTPVHLYSLSVSEPLPRKSSSAPNWELPTCVGNKST